MQLSMLRLCVSMVAVAAPALSGSASAQETVQQDGDASTGIEEIVVTAERHAQNVQRAPLAIQVFDAESALRAGLTSAADLAKLTTGLDVSAGGASTQLYIRGVGDTSFNPLANPGVAFNVDGVYVARPASIGGNFYDIARVEVLKGPQGTLYGRNANGGSINIITHEPELGSTGANLNFEAGNYSLAHVSGAVNFPLGAEMAIRGAFNIVSRDGYLSDGTNDDRQQSARLRLKWAPESGNLTLLLNGDYSHLDGDGVGYVWLPRRPGASKWEAAGSRAGVDYRNSFPPFGPLLTDNLPPQYQNSDLWNVSAQLDWNFDFATLTILPAYRHSDVKTAAFPTLEQSEDNRGSQKSIELRLGNSGADLTWVLGGYYFTESSVGSQTDRGGDPIQSVKFVYEPDTDAYAAFGQATVSLLDGLRLIGGLRYTYEKRRLDGTMSNQSPLLGTPGAILEVFASRAAFDGTTYKLGLEFDLAPRSMMYATLSTGFKAGGLNQTIPPLAVYEPERLTAVEIGTKNRFFDNRLQLNATLFHWKYKDLQDQRLTFDTTGNLNFLFFNVGEATIKGGTLELVAKPLEGGTFSAAVEYADSNYDSFTFRVPALVFAPGSTGCPTRVDGPDVVGDCAGFQVARVPRWTGTVSYEHEFMLTDDSAIVAGGSMKFASHRWLSTDFISAARGQPYAIFDANLTYRVDERYSVSLFGRNLGNKAYHTGGLQQVFVPGLFAATIAAPRTYGVQAQFNF
ncbi:TonB-dependent receptor [Rhizorhabdus dicambivorans]|uniref:TonB-dependent receptor n=1 Tax=Rhizorhabdus dicambivorans TaxID=1850238 RepID=A0A2A4FQB0_9SPHN|nr:TonB-dependent receptor [Rhizorhabdus dicambivorans]ATE65146.1 hypothetical protein CMV14_12615 [Rhizorhabdus dicambivorans]PCE39904.1 hypothetical protein COO09_23135 [Rhizorhabdus dicambivorans]